MATPRLLSGNQIAKLQNALRSFDSMAADISVDLRWTIAKNLSALDREMEVLNSIARSACRKHGLRDGEQVTEANRKRVVSFMEDKAEIMAKEVKFTDLLALKKTEIEKLPIVPGVLSDLITLSFIN